MRRIVTGRTGGPILGQLSAFENAVSGLVANQDITFSPDGTGQVVVNSDIQINSNGSLKLADADSSNYIELAVPTTVGSNITYTLPSTVTDAYYLKTDASGNLTWAETNIGVSDETASSATHYPLLSTVTSGTINAVKTSSSKLSIQPSTGNMTIAGTFDAQSHIEVGNGTGSVAMTINDGYGNANLTFNHVNGVPDIDGNCARIEVNVDSATGASMNFEIRSGVTGGAAIQPTSIFNLSESGAQVLQALGVGTAASGTTGEIRATNAITAFYSDARLKTVKGNIENALDKVASLNGILYTENDLAKELGYNSDDTYVGLLAQEVQAVLPEIVKPAPFDIEKHEDGTETSKSGENYLTIQYEKMIPLLVEAIKDLKLEIDSLKAGK
jgi:hypothetical protein